MGTTISLSGVSLDINYTLDLLTQMQPFNRVSIGVQLDLGDMGRAEKARKVDECYIAGLNAYAAGRDEEAKHFWEEAINLDPHFDPAREGLAAIAASEFLQKHVGELIESMEQ
jgi:hypothetical protein